ncbi:unnamed protein product [Toxocara canis]|uniref:Transcription initiation factor TFIID subunit 2 n=1 Tax=Toxocara canis TaxID=6265 RepID=A0A183UKG2_TOXCA|nr:unnamed protein product [Toxocara canis]
MANRSKKPPSWHRLRHIVAEGSVENNKEHIYLYSKSEVCSFLSVGESEVIFKLKDEDSYPGKYHCDVGKVYDMVKMKVTIAVSCHFPKRAETEEHFKRIILNSEKPLNRLTRSPEEEYILLEGDSSTPTRDIIEYSEFRPPSSPRQLHTNVRINLADTETVHSFAVELSKFLPTEVEEGSSGVVSRTAMRDKRAVGRESFLTDVLKSLSSTLYQFKALHFHDVQPTFRKIEYYEGQIGSCKS